MKIKDALFELLYPSRCAFCHKLTGGAQVCPDCDRDLPYTRGGAQRQSFRHVDACVSALFYEGDVRESLLRYKFGGLRFYWKIYSKILSKCVDGNGISCDIITWVPLSRRRLRRRGYNQARLIAEGLAAQLGVPCAPLLEKIRDNPAQSGAGGLDARLANVAGVYRAVNEPRIKGRSVLLVDDIVTTGSTLSECARVLHEAGAASVSAAAVARARD